MQRTWETVPKTVSIRNTLYTKSPATKNYTELWGRSPRLPLDPPLNYKLTSNNREAAPPRPNARDRGRQQLSFAPPPAVFANVGYNAAESVLSEYYSGRNLQFIGCQFYSANRLANTNCITTDMRFTSCDG